MIKYTIRKFFLPIFIVFFPAQFLFAQEGQWKTYTVNDGLAHNDVRAIAVAGDFVWFGTFGGGLSRFRKSGGDWQTYEAANSDILSNFIQTVALDGDELWIGTDQGLNRFRPATNEWQSWDSLKCVLSIDVD
ncbi:MAG: hypothetical protein ACE5I1_21765, partial [bacterium]